MNIVYVCAYSDITVGGVRSVVPQYLKYMSQIVNVYVFSYQRINFDCKQENYCQISSQSELLKKAEKVDIVVFHEVYYFKYYHLARQLTVLKIPYIVIPHCSLTTGAQEQKKYVKKIVNILWVNKFVKQALRVQYLSDYEKENSKRFTTTPIMIPNGIAINHVKPKRDYEKSSVELVFIGRFSVKQKGLDVLMKACLLIKNEMSEKNIHIKLYGTDFEGGKKYIQKRISEYGLENSVKLCAPVYGEDKQKVLLEGDVYILPSRFEGMPMGILEALQMGMPVLVTPGSGFYDIVKREKCGWCAECTPDSIAKTIIQVLIEKGQWETMSKSAVRVVENYYAWDKIALVTKREYEKLLSGSSNGVNSSE